MSKHILLAIAAAVLLVPGAVHAEVLTYAVSASIDFPADDVSFSGTLSYDTQAVDVLGQTNAGRFDLVSWDLVVEINGTQTLTFVTGSGTASLGQGVNPTQFLFADPSNNQFGFSVSYVAPDPNVAPVIPDGTPITFSFVEGAVPASVNDMELPVVGSPVMTQVAGPAVPTVSQWGLIVFAGLLALVGARLFYGMGG